MDLNVICKVRVRKFKDHPCEQYSLSHQCEMISHVKGKREREE